MPVSTRSITRQMNVLADSKPPHASRTSKAVATRSTTVAKRTRKAAEAPTSAVPHEEESAEERLRLQWQTVFAKHLPLAVLPPEYLPHLPEGANAPRLLFGWAFNRASFLNIARRRRLTFSVEPRYRRWFGDCDTFNFGDLSEDYIKHPALAEHLRYSATFYVHVYISRQTKALFTVKHMLSDRWTGMFALWTNYDIKEKYPIFKLTAKWSKVKKFMNELLNEGLPPDSERSDPLWWWSMDNNFERPFP